MNVTYLVFKNLYMKIGKKNNIYQKEFIHSLLFCCCCVIYGKILCIVGYKAKNANLKIFYKI